MKYLLFLLFLCALFTNSAKASSENSLSSKMTKVILSSAKNTCETEEEKIKKYENTNHVLFAKGQPKEACISLLSIKLVECFQKFVDYANSKKKDPNDGTGVEGGEGALLSCKKTAEMNISNELEEAAKSEKKAKDFITRADSVESKKIKELENQMKDKKAGK